MNHLDLGDPGVFDAIKDVRDDSTSTNWCAPLAILLVF